MSVQSDSSQRYDVVVIGAGPGGYVAALHAAQLGARVALIEREHIGGTCLNVGCIPTKALVRSAELLTLAREMDAFGIHVSGVELDWPKVQQRRGQVVQTLVNGLTQVIRANGVEIIRGEGRLLPPAAGGPEDGVQVRVDQVPPAGNGGGQAVPRDGGSTAGTTQRAGGEATGEARLITARSVILALGSVPARIPVPGLDLPGVVDSDEALVLDKPPRRLAIVGGGVIGVEFASIYRAFGSEVTVIEMMPTLLPPADEEISRRLALAFKKRGIEVHTGAKLQEVVAAGERLVLRYEEKGAVHESEADVVLQAVGRRPNLAGLEGTGVEFDRGGIKVDERQATSRPGVFAVGDATGGTMLAHAAFRQGIVGSEAALGRTAWWEYVVPAAVFTSPEVAWVGPTEQALRAEGAEYQVARLPLGAVAKAQVMGETEGMIKLIGEAGDVHKARLLAAHLMGPAATELVHEAVLAVQSGMTVAQMAEAIHAHPTLAEGMGEAAELFLGTPIHLVPPKAAGR